MDNALNELGPFRPKRICRNRNNQQQIEHIVLNSDSDENNDLSDSGSKYECENVKDDLSDEFESENEAIDTTQRVNFQSSTDINNSEKDFNWQEVEMSYFLFINLLVHETNNYAKTEFLRVDGAPCSHISAWKPTDNKEMLIFITLIIHTGTIQINKLNGY